MRIDLGSVFFNVSCVLVKDFSVLFYSKFSSSSMLKNVCCAFVSVALFLPKPSSFSVFPVLTLQFWSKVMAVLNIRLVPNRSLCVHDFGY